jgi:hypothetical protein
MELSWGLLALLTALCATAWFWHDTLGAREQANATALETCRSTGASLLDGTVAFRSMRLGRAAGGALQFERTYVGDAPPGVRRDGRPAGRSRRPAMRPGHRPIPFSVLRG